MAPKVVSPALGVGTGGRWPRRGSLFTPDGGHGERGTENARCFPSKQSRWKSMAGRHQCVTDARPAASGPERARAALEHPADADDEAIPERTDQRIDAMRTGSRQRQEATASDRPWWAEAIAMCMSGTGRAQTTARKRPSPRRHVAVGPQRRAVSGQRGDQINRARHRSRRRNAVFALDDRVGSAASIPLGIRVRELVDARYERARRDRNLVMTEQLVVGHVHDLGLEVEVRQPSSPASCSRSSGRSRPCR